MAHSADIHGALTGIVSPSQLAAATAAARQSSENPALYEVGDWTERAAAASAQLVAVSRIDSQKRAELMEEVIMHTPQSVLVEKYKWCHTAL